MKRIITGAAALAVALALVAPTAALATSTDTPAECVPSDAIAAYTEVTPDIEHPAVGEPTITIDNPDYVPAVEEESHIEHEFAFKKDHPNSPRWELEGWNADGNPQSEGWLATGNTRVVIDVAGSDAIGEPTITVDNPDYVAAYIEDVPDIEHAAVPAVTCPPEEEEPTLYTPSCTTVTGAATIVGTGVLSVTGGWSSTSIAVPFSGTLADIGTVLDIQASPVQYVGLHIRTAEGSIVFEEEASYAGNLWSTEAWDGVEPGLGYAAFGSITEFIELNGDVAVTGIDLLYTHPEASSTTVTSFTIGCKVYTFVPPVTEEPLPEDTVVVSDWTEPVYDCDTEAGTGVPIYQTTTTTTWTRGEDGEPVSTVTTSTEEGAFIVAEHDIAELECPVVTEPKPTEKPTPAAQSPESPTPTALAVTGGPTVPLIAGGLVAAVLLALGGTLVAARRR